MTVKPSDSICNEVEPSGSVVVCAGLVVRTHTKPEMSSYVETIQSVKETTDGAAIVTELTFQPEFLAAVFFSLIWALLSRTFGCVVSSRGMLHLARPRELIQFRGSTLMVARSWWLLR